MSLEKYKSLAIIVTFVFSFGANPGICQVEDGDCSTDDGTYAGGRNTTNTGNICYPWNTNNICFKGLTDINSSFSHDYCRNPIDPSSCHREIPWCYIDQQNQNWEYCDLPKCGLDISSNCSSPLGMSDGRIADDQIFAPTFMDQFSLAKYARLNQSNPNYWKASWHHPEYAYLSVNLKTPHIISKIHTQGSSSYYVKKFKILFSPDGHQWEYYMESRNNLKEIREFEGNHGEYDISIAYIKHPFIALKVAIIPTSFHYVPALRIELFGCQSANVQPKVTEVTVINSNTYWYLDKSPYIISAALVIPAGIRLTIEADVKVVFVQPTASLIVSGCLELKGMKGLEVRFFSNNILSYMGASVDLFSREEAFFRGIFLHSDSIGCNFSPLEHVVLIGGGITTNINVIEFNNLKIINSEIGLRLTNKNENITIKDCLFLQNSKGLEVARSGHITVQSTQFIENKMAVSITTIPDIDAIATNFNFIDDKFQDNINGIYSGSECIHSIIKLTILKCNFSRHKEYALALYQYCHIDAQYSILSSEFSGSAIRFYSYSGECSILINNSSITNLGGKNGVSVERGIKRLNITGSLFSNVSGYPLKVHIDSRESTIQINTSTFAGNTRDDCINIVGQASKVNINGNVFINNTVERVLSFELSASSVILLKNIFKNFRSKYEISNSALRSSANSILANENYWGIEDIVNISSRIFDFYEDISKSFVYVNSFYADEHFTKILNSSKFQSWFDNNGTIGGFVNGNITLSNHANLAVTKSIFVPKESCLTVIGPIELQFHSGRGIMIEGDCFSTENASLTSYESSWSGIKLVNSSDVFLKDTTILKTQLALDLINSSITINDSDVNAEKFAIISGQNYKRFKLFNSEIFCLEKCIQVDRTSLDVEMVISNSFMTSNHETITADNVGRLDFNLHKSAIESRYNSLLIIFGNGIQSGHSIISKSFLKSGLRFDSIGVKFEIIGSNFTANGRCLSFPENFGNFHKNVVIMDNVFNCGEYAIFHQARDYSTNSSLIISKNQFFKGEIQIINKYPKTITFTNNYINSTLRRDHNFLEIILTGDHEQVWRNDEVLLGNNIYENVVESSQSSVIQLNCFADSYRRYSLPIYMMNNTFRNNSVTSTIGTNCLGLTSERNILNNPNSKYEMKVLGNSNNDASETIHFIRNFWGENVSDPNVRVYDATNDRSLMKARIEPWYNNSSMTTLVGGSTGFIKPNGDIGGIITHDTVLNYEENAYVVVEDVTVPAGLKLTIEPGVKLDFVSGGINVEGTLIANGNETNKIVFNSRYASSKWKGLNFVRRNSESLRKMDFGWWEIFYKGMWWTVNLFENVYKKPTGDLLCKQAGFKESFSQTLFQCSTLSPEDKLKVAPCNDIDTPSLQIQCTQNSEFSIQECYIHESQKTYNFFNITCIDLPNESEKYVRIRTKTGRWVYFDGDRLRLESVLTNDENGIFMQSAPCLSGRGNECFALMPITRPGWYLRVHQNNVVVDLAHNNRKTDTFKEDSSFIKTDKSSEFSYIKVASKNVYLIENNGTVEASFLDPFNTTSDEIYSFKIEPINLPTSRKKRDVGVIPETSATSILKNVKIINADKGVFVRGIPPIIEDTDIFLSTSHGLHYRGYFESNIPITLNKISISKCLGTSIYFDLVGDCKDLKIVVDHCGLKECGQDCISWNGPGYLNVSNSNFDNFKKLAIMINSRVGRSHLNIASNTIFSASTESSVMYFYNGVCQGCMAVTVIDNRFNNLSEIYNYRLLDFYSVNLTFHKNVFNNVTYAVLLYNNNGLIFSFDNNVIIKCRLRELLYLNSIAQFSITNNLFLNNTNRDFFSKLRTLTLYNYQDFKAEVVNNSFFNPESEYEVFIGTNWDTSSDTMLDLSNNKWVSGEYLTILSKIYCFYNDGSKLPVNIWPAISVLNDTEFLLTRPTTESDYFFNASGGEVAFSFSIPDKNEKYFFKQSLYIPANTTLTVEPGTVIEFASGRGVVVKGKMIAEVHENKTVTLSKANNMDFYDGGSGEISATNMILDSESVKFNASIVHLTNIMFQVKATVAMLSNHISINNCIFDGVSSGLKLNTYPNSNFASATIRNSTFKKCGQGIKETSSMNQTHIINSLFLDNDQAVSLQYYGRPNSTLKITGTDFINNGYAVQGSIEHGNVEISSCFFKDQTVKGQNLDATEISLGLSRASSVIVCKNVFDEDIKTAIKLYRIWNGWYEKQSIILEENQLSNILKTALVMENMYGVDVRLYKNNFTSIISDRNIKDKASAVEYSFNLNQLHHNWPLAEVTFSQNNFQGNGGQQVVKLWWSSFGQEDSLGSKFSKLEMSSNTFLNNFPRDSVISSGLPSINVNYNIFSNPLTKYDFETLFPRQFAQNCSLNWWGSASATEIRSRIRDTYYNPAAGQVIYEPFLNKSEFLCDGINSCSGHGLCVAPDVCQCDSGWGGLSCSNYSCPKVYDCLGRGKCVGPNTCLCKAGWTGDDCSIATCTDRNNCSGKGLCVKPNECLCSEQFSGSNCTECKTGRWGETCLLCPSCKRGRCSKTTGKCDCLSPNWSGELCDECAPKHFGPLCQPLIRLFSIFPSSGPDVGGTEIYVLGNNFPNVSTYICRFDGLLERNGTWLSDEKVLCVSPQHSAAAVKVEISISPELGFDATELYYTYFPVCPPSSCGSSNIPRRGSCSLGRCNCFIPWTGDDCDQLGIPPKIDLIHKSILLLEGQMLDQQINISEGTLPIQWSLLAHPNGVTLDESSGKLTWKQVMADIAPYNVEIKCSNAFGENIVKLNISVPPSYSAALDDIPRGPFERPRSVLISGKITWLMDNPYIKNNQIPVILKIQSNYGTRTIRLTIQASKNIFYARFQPFPSEVGLTELDVRHPAENNQFTRRQSWTVYGFAITINPSSIYEYVGTHEYPNFVSLSNTGVDPLSSIQIMQVDAPFTIKLTSGVSPNMNCSLNTSNCTIKYLLPGQIVFMNATVEAREPYSGYVFISGQTKENVETTSLVTFTFHQKAPIFQLSKSQIFATVFRGSMYTDEILVTNIGLKAATNVKPILPNSTMISLVSFSTNTSLLTDPHQAGLTLGSGESAILVISFIPSVSDSLGDVNGFISISAIETGAIIHFRFIIASTNRIDLIVKVEDEYTYFSETKPLLSGAKISLNSKYGGETFTTFSNATGFGIFNNITEGYYVVYTSADKHLPDSRIIFASYGENSQVSIFLQRTSVTYSWVVKPVPFEDRYDITLEADFTANVPIPVVTMEPTQIDLETLEKGLVSSVQFKITNHGLIAAKGLQFNLPTPDSHPFLLLSMKNDQIGDIPANTTLYAVMNVNINETAKRTFLQDESKSKRSISQCFGMLVKAVYFYVCDKKRFNELMATLDNSKICDADVKPGNRINGVFRPWLAPALGWGSGSDLSKGTTVVTPVNCNCAFNYPWTCWKAIRSVTNCVKIFYSPNKLKTGSYVIKCFKNLDTIIKCVQLIVECQFKSSSGASSKRRKRSAILGKEEMGPILAHRSMAVFQYYKLGSEYVGDTEWFYLEDPPIQWWNEIFEPIFSETSEAGTLVTASEYVIVLKSPLPSNATIDMVRRLVWRYNESFYNWEKGDMTPREALINFDSIQKVEDKLKSYENEAKLANKDSIADWYIDADDAFNSAEEKPEQGVCAKVRIQIQQRMTLTRTGFEATLILENGETSNLSNIKVELFITTFGINSSDATDKFAIGNPKLEGMTDIAGSGKLDTKAKGQATWLIVPFSSAAPVRDAQYNVGGTLYYSIGTENLAVPLFPDTITVKPDPRLVVNYFLEKYVYSDDPFTPVIEPAVPFVLGILISNEGYGTATSLKITSSQPQIIDNEKGLLINFQIIGTQIKNKDISPSLTIEFGDIAPSTTEMAKWILTCSLPGTFSNFSATFQITNPLGDPRLSILDKVEFHELLHTVMIDYPVSDNVADFLIVDPSEPFTLLPHLVYDSSNGTNPLNVSHCNAFVLSESESQIKISANCSYEGWVYTRVLYDRLQAIGGAKRNNIAILDSEHNVWIQSISKKSYLQIFDFLQTKGTHIYDVYFNKINLYSPAFVETVYNISVSELIAIKSKVIEIKAVDRDSDDITYSLNKEFTQMSFPFKLDSMSGMLMTTAPLDREESDFYSVTVLATDSGFPPRTGTAFVLVNILDENDNSPKISGIPSEIVLEDITQPGFMIGKITVIDHDSGINSETEVTLKGDLDLLEFDNTSGKIIVKMPLKSYRGIHNFSLVATDKSSIPLKTSLDFTLNIISNNTFRPLFNQSQYVFFVNETRITGVIIGKVSAYDEDDPNELLTYEIPEDSLVPFSIHPASGEVFNTQPMKCSGNETNYFFEISVTDNGAPPTGKKSSTSRIIIHILDVNDNYPMFEHDAYFFSVKENTPSEVNLVKISVTDIDCSENGLVESYALNVVRPSMTNTSSLFKLKGYPGKVELIVTASFDRELVSEYLLEVTAADSGIPSLTASAKVTILVEDENDCVPNFAHNSTNVTVSSNVPVNMVLYTLEASDCDENSQIKYILESTTSFELTFIHLQENSGKIRLTKSLRSQNFTSISLQIKAFDGNFTSHTFHLTIVISDENLHPPVFIAKNQTIYVNETTLIGHQIIIFNASDLDSLVIYYEILEGNNDGLFSIDLVKGELTLIKSVDYETKPSHKLIIAAYDDINKDRALNDTTELNVVVMNVNEFPPIFVNTSNKLYLEVEEQRLVDRFYQFAAKDGDGDSVSFDMLENEDSKHFNLDSSSGYLSIVKPLLKSESSHVLVQIVAKDDGIPRLETVLDVVIVVLPIESETSSTSTTFSTATQRIPTTTVHKNSGNSKNLKMFLVLISLEIFYIFIFNF